MLAKLTKKLKHKTYELPRGWSYLPISDIIDIYSGFAFKSTDNSASGVKWLKIANVGHGKVLWEEISYLPTDYLDKYVSFSLNEGDIVVALTRPILSGELKVARISSKDIPCLLNQRVGKVVNKIELNIDFLFQLLQFNNLSAQINYFLSGTDPPNLNNNVLDLVFINLPTQDECSHIAQLLSTWDRAIETTQKLITAKEQLKKGLMQQLLTGKKRLPGFYGEWEKLGAGEVFMNNSIKGNENEQLLSATQVKGIIPRSMLEARVTMPSGELKSFKLVEPGDFVISLRSFQGGLEYSYYKGLVSPAYNVLKPKLEIDEEFYKYYFKSYDFIGHLAIAVIGIRDGKQISYDDFCTVRIPYPSIDEQKSIGKVFVTLDKEINILKSQLELYRQQKKGLMQVLLTGAVRVKVMK